MPDNQEPHVARRVQKVLATKTSAERPKHGFCRGMIDRLGNGPRFISIPLGVVLVLGGIVGFLPVVGFWMLPLGLAILAAHYSFAGRLLRKLMRVSARVRLWFRRRKEKSGAR
jgi:hypothetical protein